MTSPERIIEMLAEALCPVPLSLVGERAEEAWKTLAAKAIPVLSILRAEDLKRIGELEARLKALTDYWGKLNDQSDSAGEEYQLYRQALKTLHPKAEQEEA